MLCFRTFILALMAVDNFVGAIRIEGRLEFEGLEYADLDSDVDHTRNEALQNPAAPLVPGLEVSLMHLAEADKQTGNDAHPTLYRSPSSVTVYRAPSTATVYRAPSTVSLSYRSVSACHYCIYECPGIGLPLGKCPLEMPYSFPGGNGLCYSDRVACEQQLRIYLYQIRYVQQHPHLQHSSSLPNVMVQSPSTLSTGDSSSDEARTHEGDIDRPSVTGVDEEQDPPICREAEAICLKWIAEYGCATEFHKVCSVLPSGLDDEVSVEGHCPDECAAIAAQEDPFDVLPEPWDFACGKVCNDGYMHCVEQQAYVKAAGATNCESGLMVDTKEECEIAGPSVGYRFEKDVFNKTDRPAGCFWDQNENSYFNAALDADVASGWQGVGAICRATTTATSTTEDCARICLAESTCKGFQAPQENGFRKWCVWFEVPPGKSSGCKGDQDDAAYVKRS